MEYELYPATDNFTHSVVRLQGEPWGLQRGPALSAVDELVAHGVAYQVGGGLEFELAQRAGARRLHGLAAHAQELGRLLAGAPLRDQLDDGGLAHRESRRARVA